jgi:predicted nucleic acid-binding protein
MYFDATFLVRLYIDEPGFRAVRAIARQSQLIRSSIVGKMETEAAFHRKLREGALNQHLFTEAIHRLLADHRLGILNWLPLTTGVVNRIHDAFLNLPSHVFLRTGNAIHLATAAEAGFKEIYSNERHLLAAASLFKLKGINPLAR